MQRSISKNAINRWEISVTKRKEDYMKIDITQMEGYREDMTPEERLKLYEDYEVDLSGYVRKEVSDKNASEASAWKKKYNATLSEQERQANEDKARYETMEAELNRLRKERTVERYTAETVALGFPKDLAAQTAEALADGKMDAVFANLAKHQSARDAKLRADILKDTPTPPAGAPSGGSDYAAMAKAAFEKGDMTAGVYYTRLSQQTNA